jgi:hypothetical protein
MNGEHDPDENPCLDEIESTAPSAVSFWLGEAETRIDGHFGRDYAEKHPAVVSGFIAACATVYQAERINDAAHKVNRALFAVADALETLRDPMMSERAAGIENELYRIANTAGDAFMVLTDPKRRKARDDGE